PRGTFLSPVTFPAGAQPQAVRSADVNADGLPDIVVANFGPGVGGTGSAGGSVQLQHAAHPGSFLPPVTYHTQPRAIDVAVADVNGDGKPDLVVANLGPAPTGSVSVLLQDPARPGVFLAATSYQGFGQPLGVAIADLNGDGHPDIAMADGVSATVMLRIALTVARIQVHVRPAATAAGLCGAAVGRVGVGAGDRRRVRHDVAVVGGAPGVIEVIPVVVGHPTPPERGVAERKYRQEPGKTGVEITVRPEHAVPVAADPGVRAAPAGHEASATRVASGRVHRAGAREPSMHGRVVGLRTGACEMRPGEVPGSGVVAAAQISAGEVATAQGVPAARDLAP